MSLKRRRSDTDDSGIGSLGTPNHHGFRPVQADTRSKRPRLTANHAPTQRAAILVPRNGPDLLTPLSDELLIRILSFLELDHLLAVSPVSRRFHRLAADSHLWKALYYRRFVLPRAMRIPGFRESGGAGSRLHYSGRRALWADGGQGGLVRELAPLGIEPPDEELRRGDLDWKRQFKIRHNWSRGKCAVEELPVGGEELGDYDNIRMLVKVVEGVAITANKMAGLRAWDLRSRDLLAQVDLADEYSIRRDDMPSCIAVDDRCMDRKRLEIAIGFFDGSFGVWCLDLSAKTLEMRYRHEGSSNGKLIAMAYSHPYLFTATEAVLASLYTFEVPEVPSQADPSKDNTNGQEPDKTAASFELPAPYLLTSLTSHNARTPIALSVRQSGQTAMASIAYTFNLRRTWSIGMQNIHITPRTGDSTARSAPELSSSLVTYTEPLRTGRPSSYFGDVPPRRQGMPGSLFTRPRLSPAREAPAPVLDLPGPTTLCYTHPYLLATLPDNTLVLWLCTSTATSLTFSPGIRLWGHTSGISDADITARGKAVSVSKRGEEMRVWELEGRSTNKFGGMSVEIRPEQAAGDGAWDERRNWVGFDDEMVIVLKEKEGRESLMVYDFT